MDLLEHRIGDLFAQRDVDALAHGVNLHGVMGHGIAVLFRRRYPEMFFAYRDVCLDDTLKPGGIFPWVLPNGRLIYNLATQVQPGPNAELKWIRQAVGSMLADAAARGLTRIAIPRIGAGIGALAWPDVVAELEAALAAQPAGSTPVALVAVSLPDA